MSHSFCLSRAALLRRRPDESARERSALAVVRVRHLRDRAGPASVDEHTICAHRFPASSCPAFVPVSRARICGPGRAACQSEFRLSHSRITCSISRFAGFRVRRIRESTGCACRLFGRKPTCEFRVERHDGLEDAPSENALPATGSQLHRLPDSSMATASISTAAPNGSLETSTVERAGRDSPKKSA